MIAILMRDGNGYAISFETGEKKKMLYLKSSGWLTARVALDCLADFDNIDFVRDTTGEYKNHGYVKSEVDA